MAIDPRKISMDDYDYPLPSERIAQFPVSQRDQSKLLVYREGLIREDRFANIQSYLPDGGLVIFNETRVIHARLVFHKKSGSKIEIFCLEPLDPSEIQVAFQQNGSCSWRCLVGNARRWKGEALELSLALDGVPVKFVAELEEKTGDTFRIKFSWSPANYPFSRVLEHFGKIPLPPYISREAADDDNNRYQTIYAKNEGSVAAPTAGLHFTPVVLEALHRKNIEIARVTLHVGAGTFRPVTSDFLEGHTMHTEQIHIPAEVIRKLKNHPTQPVILVGTTTVRAIESLYWQGVRWIKDGIEGPYMSVNQWDPYKVAGDHEITVTEALDKVLSVMEEHGMDELEGTTSLMIAPGYSYRFPDAIITNFHQPRSTLLLLVSAFAGEGWQQAYEYAMNHDFRFLSYGDSCLFIKGDFLREAGLQQ